MEYKVNLIWSDSAACNELRLVLRNALTRIKVLPCWQEQSMSRVGGGIITVNEHIICSINNSPGISDEELAERIVSYHKYPKFRKAPKITSSVFMACVIALFPKCPFCFAAYIGVLGIAGLEAVPYFKWIVYFSIFMQIVLFGLFFYRAHKSKNYLPIYFIIPGCLALLLGKFFINSVMLIAIGLLLLIVASILNVRLLPLYVKRGLASRKSRGKIREIV
ncbi:hypothetical protein CLV24_10915 [Pontibacter ummariensis]|uniref:MerC mercury resistance protein n=2 Tax=Pontibacter ummariensis TaxID=1610492 RepID=A0A239FWJ3_9BACT|nr:hypothetical protein CLV24_10915 [Pontibacter ummariensis]SNS61259.1 hypothetical protein SAMN06296052_109155 [Pontibacter ummariensis]